MALPKRHISVILPYLNDQLTEDDFHQMVMLCYAVEGCHRSAFPNKADAAIQAYFRQLRQEKCTLYSRRNLSLNQCVGESRTPVSEWLNTGGWREWD